MATLVAMMTFSPPKFYFPSGKSGSLRIDELVPSTIFLNENNFLSGWSHHWVSKRSYHFIIPADADWDQHFGTDALLGRNDHLFHGLIHCNGFGHLVTLRGRDGGSAFLSGHDIMDIWDRLCSALRVR